VFDSSINQLKEYVHATSVNVLVWGSGLTAREHFAKRQKIKKAIELSFHTSDVRFSEDPELKAMIPGGHELSIPQQELWHLGACHLCVVLDTSAGPGEEIAHFVASGFARKLLIFTNEKYKGNTSFPAALRENQNQVFYSQTEYDSCSLVDRVLNRVRVAALGKYANLAT